MVTTNQSARMTIVFSGGNSRSPNDSRILSVDINPVRSIQDEVKLSGRDLTTIPEYIRRNVHLRILDLSNNILGRSKDDVISDLSDLKNLSRLNLSINELKTVPLDFTSFPFLEVLCLSGNELEYLPAGVTSLHRLKRFHCDFNYILTLPQDWSSLVSLTSLTLSNNHLEKIPTTIWNLQCLEILNLQRNRISVIDPLPDGAASRLKELRLAWNRLHGSLDLSQLANLAHLDVSHNDLDDLEVSKLQKLESLFIRQNTLKSLSLDGSRLRTLQADGNGLEVIICKQVPLYLERLDISHNNFEFLPEWVTEAKSLHTISADHNHLSIIPAEIFSCCNLMDLRLNHNFLVKLPDFQAQCHMKSLSLQYNKFDKLPYNFFWALPCLEMLNLSYNSLKSLPVSCDAVINLKTLLLSGNELSDLGNLVNLLKLSRIESLHLAYNRIKELPEGFFQALHFLRTLSLSGNELESIPSQIAKAHNLEKLYMHSNQLVSIPKFSESDNLQVLDLACNKVHQLELASIVAKDLTYLDLSANFDLKIDPTDFQHLCCQRSVAVVDVNCAGRQAPLNDNNSKEAEISCPWILGFTESQDGNTRIYIEFQKDPSSGKQEALIALMELDDAAEVGELRNVLPELLKVEREGRESYPQFLRNCLVSSVRYLRGRGYSKDLGITMCHLSSFTGSPVTLRLGTIGRPSSCVLGRAGNIIVLAQRQDEPPFGIEDWASAMQVTDVCYNNYLSNLQSNTPKPKGTWTSIPEPEVRELVLSPQDKFLVFGDSLFSKTIPADEVCRQVQATTSPVATGKALSEMYSALTSGKRECIAVIMLKPDVNQPVEEEVEKYRCWEFMLEQNHKLLFTKELETLHKTIVLTGEQTTTPSNGDPGSWYTTALSKYKCPLPSHRGRYYCYGNKTE